MVRHILQLASITLFIIAMILAGHMPAHTDTSVEREVRRQPYDHSYRSPSPRHKVIAQGRDLASRDSIIAAGGQLVEDYGSFALYSVPASAAAEMSAQSVTGPPVRDDMNVILLRAGAFDTTAGEPLQAPSLAEADPADEQLYLVQMEGPVKQEWLAELARAADIISYVPNNAYLVRASGDAVARINEMKLTDGSFIQYTGSYRPAYKIAPEISLASEEEVAVTVQMVNCDQTDGDIRAIISKTSATLIEQSSVAGKYVNARLKVRASAIAEVARKSSVVWVEPWDEPRMLDEKQNLIISGGYTGNQVARPGYMDWLRAKGLDKTPEFLVDIADSGIDRGNLDPDVLHGDFLNSAGLSRVAYARYVGEQDLNLPVNDTGGHGTINAAIVGGYNTRTGFPYTDSDGYSYGLGVHPFVKLGVTKIFSPNYTKPSLFLMVEAMYRDGTRISSNSWGAYNNNYTVDCQTYDYMVRDAQRTTPGNQEMTVVFASGNKGAGGNLTTPGSAKNVITVGASESIRPGFDGCGVGSSGADDINSLINFSSGGPASDGRIKPDIVAPGTHIQGARSQDPGYAANGICGPNDYPLGQSIYTWSSGTSHAAPAVAGAAALIRQFFEQTVGHPPSPAMVKAYLTNSTTYLTGYMAGDTLPGDNQGWGLLNIARALDDAPRIMVDQDQVIKSTGQSVTIKGRVADPSKPFRVTLAWTDAPGSPLTSSVVNDLDLQVEVGGKTYKGNVFNGGVSVEGGVADKLNNLESVWAPGGVSGDFTIQITGANIPGDGLPGDGDSTDQDFALVVYNAGSQDGGGTGAVDSPPSVTLAYPVGGEEFIVGNIMRILWDASDDKGIQSQRVEISFDGVEYNTIGIVDGNARQFDWRIPSVPTPLARVKVSALDGVNLPVSSASANSFNIVKGPPDLTPPQVQLLSPQSDTIVGGGLTMTIKWKETDNVGVIRRVLDLSTDGGESFQPITSITAPSSGETQAYEWQIPATLSSTRAKVRIIVYDGSDNLNYVVSNEKFEIWPMPIITAVEYKVGTNGEKDELELSGRFFRNGETEIWSDDRQLSKIKFEEKFYTGNGMSRKVSSFDKKLSKRMPRKKDIAVTVRLPKTGQVSPPFVFRRVSE